MQSPMERFLKIGKIRVLSATAAMIVLIAVADRSIGSKASLGILYVLPMMMAATVITAPQTLLLALLCSILRACFDIPAPNLEKLLRFPFAIVTYAGSGLIVTALIRNRGEQQLRRDLEEQLKVLV